MFAEDLSVFFSSDEHAVEAEITPNGALAPVAVTGIYHGSWLRTQGLAMDIGTAAPAIQLPSASVPCAWQEALVRILAGPGKGSYTAVEHHADGTGVSFLTLHKV